MNCEEIMNDGLKGIIPRKNYRDQHFIVCQEIINKVVESAQVSLGDTILEIGPGPGQLTESLLQTGANVVAIEIDTRFKSVLEEVRLRYPRQLEIIWGSALTVTWPSECNKIVMNPPFSILEALLEFLYDYREIECVSMIIGKKYYINSTVNPGKGGFSKTALMTQARFIPELISNIPKECFYPQAGKKCVVMKLNTNNNPNPILRRLADAYIMHPQLSVNIVVQQALEVLNKRARKYRTPDKFFTFQNIGINPSLKGKLLQDLGNHELSGIVSKLTANFNRQRKR